MSRLIIIVVSILCSLIITESVQTRCGIKGQSKHPVWKIVGGYTTEPAEYPWMTLVGGCGGALIGDQWVITAGHCVGPKDWPAVGHIYINAYDMAEYDFRHNPVIVNETQVVIANVTKDHVFRHPGYDLRGDRPDNGRPYNDITLLKLSHKLDFDGQHKHLTPLCLPDKHIAEEELIQSYCTATGWGGTGAPFDGNEKLRATSVPIISSEFCSHSYPKDFNSTQMVCGGHLDGGHGTCNGDSGGPLQCRLADGKWYSVGVVSWGVPCATVNPDVYASVSGLLDWIHTTISTH